ncbi:g1656 [Coccomyxa elongata]
MYNQINIIAPGGARAAELHQANSQDPLNTNGNTTAVLWGPYDPHQDKPVDGQLGVGKLTTPDLFGPLKGLGIINLKDQIDNGGLIYLVILTKDHPDGEMRGQLGAAEPPLVAG